MSLISLTRDVINEISTKGAKIIFVSSCAWRVAARNDLVQYVQRHFSLSICFGPTPPSRPKRRKRLFQTPSSSLRFVHQNPSCVWRHPYPISLMRFHEWGTGQTLQMIRFLIRITLYLVLRNHTQCICHCSRVGGTIANEILSLVKMNRGLSGDDSPYREIGVLCHIHPQSWLRRGAQRWARRWKRPPQCPDKAKSSVSKWCLVVMRKHGGQDSHLGTPTGPDPESGAVGLARPRCEILGYPYSMICRQMGAWILAHAYLY